MNRTKSQPLMQGAFTQPRAAVPHSQKGGYKYIVRLQLIDARKLLILFVLIIFAVPNRNKPSASSAVLTAYRERSKALTLMIFLLPNYITHSKYRTQYGTCQGVCRGTACRAPTQAVGLMEPHGLSPWNLALRPACGRHPLCRFIHGPWPWSSWHRDDGLIAGSAIGCPARPWGGRDGTSKAFEGTRFRWLPPVAGPFAPRRPPSGPSAYSG